MPFRDTSIQWSVAGVCFLFLRNSIPLWLHHSCWVRVCSDVLIWQYRKLSSPCHRPPTPPHPTPLFHWPWRTHAWKALGEDVLGWSQTCQCLPAARPSGAVYACMWRGVRPASWCQRQTGCGHAAWLLLAKSTWCAAFHWMWRADQLNIVGWCKCEFGFRLWAFISVRLKHIFTNQNRND